MTVVDGGAQVAEVERLKQRGNATIGMLGLVEKASIFKGRIIAAKAAGSWRVEWLRTKAVSTTRT